MSLTEAQRIGRLAELYVEERLTKAGWLCGNFNVSVENSAAWDLFAKKEGKTRAIRVKGSSTTDVTWNSSDGPQKPLRDWTKGDDNDWTAIVINVDDLDKRSAFVLPTGELVKYFARAGLDKSWTILHLRFHSPKRRVAVRGQYDLQIHFDDYRDQWDL